MSSAVSQGPLLAPSIATAATALTADQSTSERKQDNYEGAGETHDGSMAFGGDQQQAWANKMNGMMKELYESRKEDMHSENMDNVNNVNSDIMHNGNESETKYPTPTRPLGSPSGNSLSNGNADDCIHDINSSSQTPVSRHHRLNMMRGEALSQETSKLLREILQNKEKRLQQKLSNGSSMQGLLGGVSVPDDRAYFTKFLQREGAMYRGSDMDLDNSPVHSEGTPADCLSSASEDSDQENNGSNVINGVSQKSAIKYTGMNNNSSKPQSPVNNTAASELDNQQEAEEEDDDDENSNNTSNADVNGGDSVQAKRARVENIITNMRLSPSRAPLDLAGGMMLQEVRRQKRKQYQPQQMDNNEHTAPKQRKMEKETLRSQLKHMQQQLLHMQQQYLSLYEGREPISDHESVSDDGASDAEGKDKACDNNNILGSSNNNKHLHNGSSKRIDMDSLCYNDRSQINRLSPFEKNSSDPSQLSNKLNLNKHEHSTDKKTFSVKNKMPVDAEGLAKVLKEEIASSIGGLVDSIVAKIMTPKKKEEPTIRVPAPHREVKKEKSCVPNHPHHHAAENNKELLTPVPIKEKEHHLHKTIRTKVTDKMLPMESPHKLFHDLHRPHPHIYAPPPPYFSTQVHPPPPIFPPPPEQTEALSLVVSTPKKKRTKVTDTRLSPRAARALLQETPGTPHGMELEKHHHMHPADHYHHGLVPVTLPTSVAIPNPSLQHSDVLAMYTHADHHGPYGDSLRSTTHSPSTGEHISPSMGHTPMDSMSMSMFKAGDQDSHENSLDSPIYDGSPMVSFLKAFNNIYKLVSFLTNTIFFLFKHAGM